MRVHNSSPASLAPFLIYDVFIILVILYSVSSPYPSPFLGFNNGQGVLGATILFANGIVLPQKPMTLFCPNFWIRTKNRVESTGPLIRLLDNARFALALLNCTSFPLRKNKTLSSGGTVFVIKRFKRRTSAMLDSGIEKQMLGNGDYKRSSMRLMSTLWL